MSNENIFNERPKVIITFPTAEQRDHFMSWLSDGGGEYEYLMSSESHDAKPIERLDYSNAFPAWGYNPAQDGEPTIEAWNSTPIRKL